jgi:hypothetical protein
MENLGAAKKIIGMEIHKDRKVGKYIEKILKCLGMKNTNDYSTCHSFQTFNSISIEK